MHDFCTLDKIFVSRLDMFCLYAFIQLFVMTMLSVVPLMGAHVTPDMPNLTVVSVILATIEHQMELANVSSKKEFCIISCACLLLHEKILRSESIPGPSNSSHSSYH